MSKDLIMGLTPNYYYEATLCFSHGRYSKGLVRYMGYGDVRISCTKSGFTAFGSYDLDEAVSIIKEINMDRGHSVYTHI